MKMGETSRGLDKKLDDNHIQGKGVVSKILPDDEMPMITHVDGDPVREDTKVMKRADVITNPLGVINRLNPSSLVEAELNYISTIVRYRMEGMDLLEDKYNYLCKFLSMTDELQENLQGCQSLWKSLDRDEQELFINDIIENGISLKQEPFFRNINSMQVYKIYNELGIELSPNNMSIHPIYIGEMYYLRLRHESIRGFSARSVDNLNMSGLPTRTRDNRNHSSRISDTPIRIGELLAA